MTKSPNWKIWRVPGLRDRSVIGWQRMCMSADPTVNELLSVCSGWMGRAHSKGRTLYCRGKSFAGSRSTSLTSVSSVSSSVKWAEWYLLCGVFWGWNEQAHGVPDTVPSMRDAFNKCYWCSYTPAQSTLHGVKTIDSWWRDWTVPIEMSSPRGWPIFPVRHWTNKRNSNQI